MFCDKCGGMMLPKETLLVCTRCGHEEKIKDKDAHVQVKKAKKKNKVLFLEEEPSTLPVTRVECSECNNMEAFWWLVQTRRADEPETRFLRCTKCKFTWREYD
jgi:DNA-directed RNA polymerase subunit M